MAPRQRQTPRSPDRMASQPHLAPRDPRTTHLAPLSPPTPTAARFPECSAYTVSPCFCAVRQTAMTMRKDTVVDRSNNAYRARTTSIWISDCGRNHRLRRLSGRWEVRQRGPYLPCAIRHALSGVYNLYRFSGEFNGEV